MLFPDLKTLMINCVAKEWSLLITCLPGELTVPCLDQEYDWTIRYFPGYWRPDLLSILDISVIDIFRLLVIIFPLPICLHNALICCTSIKSQWWEHIESPRKSLCRQLEICVSSCCHFGTWILLLDSAPQNLCDIYQQVALEVVLEQPDSLLQESLNAFMRILFAMARTLDSISINSLVSAPYIRILKGHFWRWDQGGTMESYTLHEQ